MVQKEGIKKDPRAAYPGGERRKVSGVTGTGYEIRNGSGSRVPRSVTDEHALETVII